MARNSYLQVARLSTHPLFSLRTADLRCPVKECGFATASVKAAEDHFMGHGPSRDQAYRWLSGRRWEREAAKRGWAVPEAAE